MGICLGLLGQFCRKGIAAHGGEPCTAFSGHYEAAGFQLVADLLVDGIFLAGDQSFVCLQAAGYQNAVGTDLVPGYKFHNVIPDQ